MRSLAPFLPPHLVARLTSRTQPRTFPHEDRFPAALLLTDLSGFTAMTERLERRGREGAEEIAALVTRSFAPAIGAIEREGGSIVGFGGDAIFALFAGGSPVRRAVRAAEEIRAAFERRPRVETSAGPVRLEVSQAVGYGQLRALHLGDDDRRQYVILGPAVQSVVRLEARAGPGELRLSAAARERAAHERTPPRLRSVRPRAPAALLRPYLPAKLGPLLGSFEGEYRRATVLFLESRASRTGVLQAFHQELQEVLDRYDGLLLKTDPAATGLRWLCLFGIPQTHEDDPDRAARAALEMVGGGHAARARAGMHSGTIVNVAIGARGRRSIDVMGDVVNTAARALDLARWSEALVTEGLRTRLSGVTTSSRGHLAVKGKAAAVELHALVSARRVVKALRASHPLVGRERELRALESALRELHGGKGASIGVRGDAGLGKSRLAHEAGRMASGDGILVHQGSGSPFGAMPYAAIRGLLLDALGLSDLPEAGAVVAAIDSASARLDLSPTDRRHLVALLGATEPRSPVALLDAVTARLNDMMAIRSLVAGLAKETPRLLVLEDMHWADEASRDAVAWLARSAAAPYLLLLLYRPGYAAPAGTSELSLSELPGEEVDRLVRAHLGRVPDPLVDAIRERAAGNPFYVEQLARHVERASGGVGASSRDPFQALPDTLEALVAARLDDLTPPAKRVAQVGAVIGRSFLEDVLRAQEGMSRVAASGIEELVARELVVEGRPGARREWLFKHIVTRDVAYASILGSRRRRLHATVADAIEAQLGEERETTLASLGYHRELAGQRGAARAAYLDAAKVAVRRFAHEDAERLYRSYLHLVDGLSSEAVVARSVLASDVLRLRGRLPEARAELVQALSEARRLASAVLEWQTLVALASLEVDGGNLGEAERHCQAALEVAQRAGDRRGEASALSTLGTVLAERRERERARQHFEEALRIDRDLGERKLEGLVTCNLAILAKLDGRREEAEEWYVRSLLIAREVGDRRGEGIALGNLAILQEETGRIDEALASYEAALAVHREVGGRRSEATTLANLAGLHSDLGHLPESCRLLEQAREYAAASENRKFESLLLVTLVPLQARVVDDPAAMERLLVETERVTERAGDPLPRAHFACTRGHLALRRGESARDALLRARAIASELDYTDAELESNLSRLERAQAAVDAGEGLLLGYRPEDLPESHVAWLRKHRPEVSAVRKRPAP